jgi:glucan phosphoethanolaminetransferase (alkaline phosphatase superfamily)
MKTPAQALAARHTERAGKPENLADIIARSRFAAEWHQGRAENKRAQSHGFYAMRSDERYTTQQREDALYAAANLMGEAQVHEDAARFADSIADALIAVTG